MYKRAGRFYQSLTQHKRGRRVWNTRKTKSRSKMIKELDKEAARRIAAEKEHYTESDRTPRLIKRTRV